MMFQTLLCWYCFPSSHTNSKPSNQEHRFFTLTQNRQVIIYGTPKCVCFNQTVMLGNLFCSLSHWFLKLIKGCQFFVFFPCESTMINASVMTIKNCYYLVINPKLMMPQRKCVLYLYTCCLTNTKYSISNVR